MPAGRPPKPTHLKLLEGNPGKRPLNADEPQPPLADERTRPPDWLSGEARAKWDEEFPRLWRLRMITEADLTAFARYCQAYGRLIVAESHLAKQGDVLLTKNDFPMQNPYLAVANKAMEQLDKLEVKFGLDPSSRSRVSTGTSGAKSNRFLELAGGSKKANKTRA